MRRPDYIGRLLSGVVLGAVASFVGSHPAAAQESHINTVKARGTLLCGTDNTTPGFGYLNTKTGTLEGMDVDMCRAVAAAVLGSPDKVKFIIVTDKSRFNALQTGQTDVVFAHTTVTPTRESAIGVSFLPITFYDGTGALVKKSLGVGHIAELDGATICTTQGSATEVMWSAYIKAHGWKASTKVLTYQDTDKLYAAFETGRCDVMSTDKSALAGWKGNSSKPDSLVILPETMDKEPLAGFAAGNDPKWHTALRWVIFATFEAEEHDINSKSLGSSLKTSDPYLQKFLGVNGTLGTQLGLPADFVQKVISSVGNYGEIYNRNLGPKSPYAIEREGSQNAEWNHGGLLYSPPWY
jgi:general L-amino acid transport system substrate-binding protein